MNKLFSYEAKKVYILGLKGCIQKKNETNHFVLCLF